MRHGLWLPVRSGLMAMMPAYLDEPKSLGLGVQDVACAHYVYNTAQESGIGTRVEL